MLYILMGQSCTGKSTVASQLKDRLSAAIYTGKDYLKLAKNEPQAWAAFAELLEQADRNESNLIYVLTDTELLSRLPALPNAVRVKFTADIETIQTRFAARMNGKLPPPVAAMLQRQYDSWAAVTAPHCIDTTNSTDAAAAAESLLG